MSKRFLLSIALCSALGLSATPALLVWADEAMHESTQATASDPQTMPESTSETASGPESILDSEQEMTFDPETIVSSLFLIIRKAPFLYFF